MKVIESKVLIKVKSNSYTQKIGGLEVPVGSGEYEVAEVISVGEKVEGVKEGDTIYIYPQSGKQFTHDGDKYRVISLSEIIVVL